MGDNGRGMVGIALALVVVLAPAMRAPAFEASVKTRESRPGVTESFLLVRPEGPPVASVILLSGGNGVVSLNRFGPRWTHGNFLVRSRDLFAGEGIKVK